MTVIPVNLIQISVISIYLEQMTVIPIYLIHGHLIKFRIPISLVGHSGLTQCAIIFIGGGQCSWVAKIFLAIGDVISLVV